MMNTMCFRCKRNFDIEKNIVSRQRVGSDEKIFYACPRCGTEGRTVRMLNPPW